MRDSCTRFLNGLVVTTLLLFLLAANVTPVGAAVEITVNTTADENGGTINTAKCSLREAVIAANENRAFGGCRSGTAGLDYVRIPSSATTYKLAIKDALSTPEENQSRTGDLDIRESVQILGGGTGITIISGEYATDRIFHVLTTGAVTIRDLTITGGRNVDKAGGVWVPTGGRVTMLYLLIASNQATNAGGGIVAATGSVVTLSYSEVSDNYSDDAAGILNEGMLTINNSLIQNNHGIKLTGGLVANSLGTSEKTRIINSTVALNDFGSIGGAAGISVTGGSFLEILNSTISDNRGVGLELLKDSLGTIKNTLIARQREGSAGMPNCSVVSGSLFQSQGYNMMSDGTCGFAIASDQVVTLDELKLDVALADNGGPTLTYALLEGSAAADAGTNTGCPGIDQRRYGRPVQGDLIGGSRTCDIGAFELLGSSNDFYVPLIRK